MKASGIVLIVLGIVMMIYTGFTFFTTEKVVDIGPLEVNREKPHTIAWPPIVGGVLLVGGIVLLVAGNKKG